jgi:hypothetical protein
MPVNCSFFFVTRRNGMTRKHFEAAASVFHRLVTANEGSKTIGVHEAAAETVRRAGGFSFRLCGGDFYWYTRGYGEALASVAGQLATEFEGFNPDFDRERFLEACGLNLCRTTRQERA